jgi:hypothetical protein
LPLNAKTVIEPHILNYELWGLRLLAFYFGIKCIPLPPGDAKHQGNEWSFNSRKIYVFNYRISKIGQNLEVAKFLATSTREVAVKYSQTLKFELSIFNAFQVLQHLSDYKLAQHI